MATRFIDHLLEGDHASRPAYDAVPQGTLYSCSDHGLIYQSDGATAWATWATLGASIADILDLPTAEDDASLVMAPDGAGGVEFRAEAGGGGIDSGTSFPVSPSAGDLFHRTDLSPALWRYDGTRWLCTCAHEVTFNNFESLGAQSDTGADQTVYRGAVNLEYARWLVDFVCTTYVATNSGLNYWTVTLQRSDAANTTNTITSFTTAADTQANWVEHRVAIDALLDSTARLMKITIRDTASPGVIYLAAGYSYLHAIVP